MAIIIPEYCSYYELRHKLTTMEVLDILEIAMVKGINKQITIENAKRRIENSGE